MKLQQGSLYWPTTCDSAPAAEVLRQSIACDVLVVGSGITGALVAFHLSTMGARVVVVDRRAIAAGSTPASTALLLYDIDTPLTELRHQIGRDRATEGYLASYAALNDLAKLVQESGIDCDLIARPSLYLASSSQDIPFFEREAGARQVLGLPADLLTRSELMERFDIDRPAAIVGRGFEINPLRLTHALLRAAMERGARLFHSTEVDIDPSTTRRAPFAIAASGGSSITSDWIVVATGYEAPERFKSIRALTDLYCTYAIATKPLSRELLPQHPLIWEHASPYLYARTVSDGRVLVGGEDEPFGDASFRCRRLPDKVRKLKSKIRSLVAAPDLEAEFSWAGTFAQSADGLPFIGRHPCWPNVLFALGYGGNGITFGFLAAQLIRDVVGGRTSDRADLFAVDRPVAPQHSRH